MSSRLQNLLTIVLIIMLPVLAFVAGFLANELFDLPWETTTYTTTEEAADFELFWEAWGHVEDSYIGEAPRDKQVTYAAIRGILNSLNDPYSIFLEPVVRQEEIISLSGNYGGIGVYVERLSEGDENIYLVPIPDNPAALAGVMEGDVLLAVNGEMLSSELSINDIDQLLRGEIGDAITLTLLRNAQSEPFDIEVEIGQILVPSVFYRVLPENPEIGYIQLSRFSGESPTELEEAIADLTNQGVSRLVLDLRGNGGGLLDASVEIADQFVADGQILKQISRAQGERLYMADDAVVSDLPLVVLVNRGTASAAEIVAGALQDLERATLIGSVTFGKGSVQLVYDLSDGSSIHITSARWFTPDGSQIDQQGLTPDIVVAEEVTPDGRDVVLERAVDYLLNQN